MQGLLISCPFSSPLQGNNFQKNNKKNHNNKNKKPQPKTHNLKPPTLKTDAIREPNALERVTKLCKLPSAPPPQPACDNHAEMGCVTLRELTDPAGNLPALSPAPCPRLPEPQPQVCTQHQPILAGYWHFSSGCSPSHSDSIFLALTSMPLTCKSFLRAVSHTALQH